MVLFVNPLTVLFINLLTVLIKMLIKLLIMVLFFNNFVGYAAVPDACSMHLTAWWSSVQGLQLVVFGYTLMSGHAKGARRHNINPQLLCDACARSSA